MTVPSTRTPNLSKAAALEVLRRFLEPQIGEASKLEQDYEVWLRTIFGPWVSDKLGNPTPFPRHLQQIWEWIWSIRIGEKQAPLIAILPRGGAKSTTAELGVAALAARRTRRYGLYICATQAQADDHVQNCGALFESSKYAQYYPATAGKRVNKYGYSSGWNRQRLRTSSGFTIDSIGLDTAARGVKLEETRPDLIILDDIDKELDTPEATKKKIKLITTTFLPAGSADLVVLGIQNLVIEDGVFARLANEPTISEPADFLQNKILIGPYPAIRNAQVVIPVDGPRKGKYTIIGGEPIWEGQNLQKAQENIDDWGFTAWKTEAQQEVGAPTDSLFKNIDFEAITIPEADCPSGAQLVSTVVWCDPAVTDTKHSDSHGVQVDSLGIDDLLYRRRSWEGRESPEAVLKRAILWAIEYQADHIGVETDQGGDLWEVAFNKVWDDLLASEQISKEWWGEKRISFKAEKAGSGYGSKAHRGSLMLRDYEVNKIRHVATLDGSHLILKRALLRAFVKKPFDLADAAFWGWNDLLGELSGGLGAAADEPMTVYGTRTNSELARSLHNGSVGPDDAWREGTDRMRIGRLWQGHRNSLWRTGGNQPPVTGVGAVQGEEETQ